MNKSSLLSWIPALTLFPAVFRISGRPVCVTMAAVFVFRELLVFTFYHCVYYIGRPSLFPPSVPPSPPSRTLHVLIQILMLSISPLQEFLTVFFFFSSPSLFLLPFPLSLFICLQCDQVQVIPIPSVCILIFFIYLLLLLLTSISLKHSLCLLFVILLSACTCWQWGYLSLWETLPNPTFVSLDKITTCWVKDCHILVFFCFKMTKKKINIFPFWQPFTLLCTFVLS